MARIRTIKPEFPQSESMGRVSRDARLCFIMMWTLSDDVGRLRGNSRMLASILFPYDDDAPGLIDGWLDELEQESCIVRYYDGCGASYIEICHWKSHQKIDKPSESKLPGPDSSNTRERSRIVGEQSRKVALDLGSRIKEGTKERKGSILSASEAEGGRNEYSEQFESFWKIYPAQRRTKKQEAYRKWKLAVKRADAELLIQRAADYAASEQGRSDFAVMPSVWLNGAMWLDDPEAWNRSNETNKAKEVAW